MRQKVFSILALLLMAVTGAMAQTETLLTTITATAKEQASYSTANVATVSFSYTAGGSSAYLANWGWWGYGWTATVTAAEGYTITKCIFYDDANRTATDSEAPFVAETTEEDKTPRINGTPIDGGNYQSKGLKKIEVYGYVTPTATQYSVTLAEGTDDAGNWTISPATAEEGQTVTITYNGTKKVKSVKAVKKAVLVTAITINKTATEITEGETETLSVSSVTPDNAADKTVTWSSDNTTVATVNASTGEVTAVAVGTANITATANDGSGVTATCAVTVKTASIAVTSVTITNAPTEALFVNSTGTLTATVLPNDATDPTVTWSSSDPDYVSINATTGAYEIKGTKGYGSATITATAGDKTATCTITGKVTYTSLSVGTVLRTGDTFYTGGSVSFNTTPAMTFNGSNGVITVVEATSGSNKYYKFQRGSNGTMPNVTSFKVTDSTDGVYITGGSGTSSDRFTLAVHTKTQTLSKLTVSASGNPAIYYVSGKTWAQAIANHATENSGWGVDIGRTVWYEMEGRDLNGEHGSRVTADDVIDPTKYYELAW